MALTNEQVLKRIEEIHSSRPFYEHPTWAGLIDGSFNLEQTREFARQFGIIPLHNHNYHGRLYVHCPDPKWREMIAEVVYEEGTGRIYADGVPHNQLYYNFGEGLGMSREDLGNAKYCPGALAFKAYFQNMCEQPFLEGVSSHMLAGEAQGPGVFAGIAEHLKNNHGLDDKAVAFWVVHDVADEDHSGIGKQLLDEFASSEGDRQRVLQIVQETVDMTFLMFDSMYDNIKTLN